MDPEPPRRCRARPQGAGPARPAASTRDRRGASWARGSGQQLTDEEIEERREEQRRRLDALHDRFVAQVAELVDGDRWRLMLEAAARFHQYSFRNLLLIQA